MRILLDENLDWRLERYLPGHEIKSVPRLGWAGLKNGKLLARAAQENFAKLKLAIVALRAPSNRLADTSPLMPKVIALLPKLKPGTVAKISA